MEVYIESTRKSFKYLPTIQGAPLCSHMQFLTIFINFCPLCQHFWQKTAKIPILIHEEEFQMIWLWKKSEFKKKKNWPVFSIFQTFWNLRKRFFQHLTLKGPQCLVSRWSKVVHTCHPDSSPNHSCQVSSCT